MRPVSHTWFVILGLVIGLLIMLPITRALLRRAEKRARAAERRAQESERLAQLGSMTGGLAHEIKNPLSTIGLNAQLLAEDLADAELPPDHRDRLLRRLETLSREVTRLKTILTDFLQFAGRIKLDPHPHDLVRIVDELADFFHPQCQQANIVLRTSHSSGAVTASVDETLLKQAILNLMINAVQAMAPADAPRISNASRGELIIRVEADDADARIHVIDTGPGIPSDKVDEIFRPYVSFKSGGTGLGLPTARRIVEEHGGRLTLHSEPAQGSDFTIHIPLNSRAVSASPPAA
ncbi:MAG TPA: ATP-binding protein [Phycisphaerales bacterium]|nr:ATP-binding protein [Phycisphaerales bacterium]